MSVLSFGKRRQLNKDRKLSEYRESLSGQTGIMFSADLVSEDKRFPLIKYIINALILFGVTFGTLDCFVTSFELDLTVQPMFLTCLIASLVFSFMYISNKAKILTYLAVFFGIVFAGMRFFSIINSGVSAMVNNVLIYIDDKSGLPFIREYNIFYKDEYVAMSVALCVMAVALMLILNIFISEKMSFVMLFVITFPIVQFGMYFNYSPSKIAMFCVASGWILVAAVRLTNAYNGLTAKMVSSSSIKKHRHSYGFVTDSRNVASIAVVWLAFATAVTGFVFSTVSVKDFTVSLPTNSIREATERSVKNFLSYGFSSMFSRETSADGSGQLSNQSQVSYDGRADLEVYLVNYRVNRIYLRSFSGYVYNSSKLKWVLPVELYATEGNWQDVRDRYLVSADILKDDYSSGQNLCQSRHRIGIKIKDGSLAYQPVAAPYYSFADDDSDLDYRSSGEMRYSDFTSVNSSDPYYYTFYTIDTDPGDVSGVLPELTGEEKNSLVALKEEAENYAMYVPERNMKAMAAFCEEFNISKDDGDVISEVIGALENNFTYTLKPGKVPYGEDYINYFLLANRKGYCQHFASAAVMLFRYLGIPARYAEGYVIDREDFIAADYLDEENADDWIETPYMNAGAVQRVEVPDASAHAWVEIFRDGIGWTPVEATTAAAEEEKSLFASLFGNGGIFGSAQENLINGVRKIDAEKTKHNVFIMFVSMLAVLAAAYLTKMLYTVLKRHRRIASGDGRTRLGRRYAHAYDTWKYATGRENVSVPYSEFSETMTESGFLPEGDESFCVRLEKCLFGAGETDEEECGKLGLILKKYRKYIARNMKPLKKFRYYFVLFKW